MNLWPFRKHATTDSPADACRDWLSEDEWQEALRQIERRPLDFNGRDRRDKESPRHAAVKRCLLRVERRGRILGMLLVRTRNLSSTGMCVVHGGRIPRFSKVTVVLDAHDGRGVITTGQAVWCKRIPASSPLAHEIGLQFDNPIDVTAFIETPDTAETNAA